MSKRPITEQGKAWQREYRKNNPAKVMLWAARERATKRNVPCTITEEDIQEVIPSHCPYFGMPLERSLDKKSDRSSAMTLDRIIPELGYVKGNIQVISWLANRMKFNATKEQLIRFARKVLDEEGIGTRC